MLLDLKEAAGSSYGQIIASQRYVCYPLNDFVFYNALDSKMFPGQKINLDEIVSNTNQNRTFLLDGIISSGGISRYVEAVEVDEVSIDGFEDTQDRDSDSKTYHSVGDLIYVKTATAGSLEDKGFGATWYLLEIPAAGYEEHYQIFQWLANLAKHALDYLAFKAHWKQEVHLINF